MRGGKWLFGGPFNPLNLPLAGVKAYRKAKKVNKYFRKRGINDQMQGKLLKKGWKTFKSI